jgi:hypothetical protein
LGLELGVLETVFLVFCWLLHRYWVILQRFSYADVLFVMGTLAGMLGSIGMMRNPYRVSLSPTGVWASRVQSSEEEKHAQMVDELTHQVNFGLRALAVGLITILLAITLTFIK